MTTKYYYVASLLLGLWVADVGAMEVISEDEMATQTAQDGVSIFTNVNWVTNYTQVTDTNGISSSSASTDSLGITRTLDGYGTSSSGVAGGVQLNGFGLQFLSSANAVVDEGLQLVVDAGYDTGSSKAVLHISGIINSAVTKLRVPLTGLSLANASGNNASKFLVLSNGYIDLAASGGSSLFEVELGNEPINGHMLKFTNANFGTINMGTIKLCDKSDSTCNNQKLGFDVTIGGTAGLSLSGVTVDINNTGMILTNFPYTSTNTLDVTVNNITAGNGSTTMGAFGVKGLYTTGLAITLAGKS